MEQHKPRLGPFEYTDYRVVTALYEEVFQEFALSNFERELTEKELQMAADIFWEVADDHLSDAMYAVIDYIIDETKLQKYYER